MKLPDFIKVYPGPEGRVNSTIILGDKDTVVVDTQVTLEDGRALKDLAVKMSKGKAIVAVLLTHEHFDHMAGNQYFDCPIISTESARKAIINMNTAQLPEGYIHTPPNVTFSERLSLDMGDFTLHLRRDGGHSEGQCSIFIPEAGVLLTGDNVFNGPTPYVSNSKVPEWIEILTRLHACDPELVIPGHGPPGTKAILLEQRAWLESFLSLSQECAKKGLPPEIAIDKIMAALPVDPSRKQVVALGISRIYESMDLG